MSSIESGRFLQQEQLLTALYPSSERTHDRTHAQQTAVLALEISHEPEYRDLLDDEDRFDLTLAALCHDAGYQKRDFSWSGTQWEHPIKSRELFDQVVVNDPSLNRGEARNAVIGYLILNHDNTNHSFPFYKRFEGQGREGITEPFGITNLRPGMLFSIPSIPNTPGMMEYVEQYPPDKVKSMLHILQEADSRLGDHERTIAFSKSRCIPVFAGKGEVGMPMWQYSGLANVLLAGKRALLDAYTQTGQAFAWQMFIRTREFINRTIQKELALKPESGEIGHDNVGEILRFQDIQKFIWAQDSRMRFDPGFEITLAYPKEKTHLILDWMGINDRLSSRLIDPNEAPLDNVKYEIERKQLEKLAHLRAMLIRNYAFDPLTETDGALRVIGSFPLYGDYADHEYTLIPPIFNQKGKILKLGNDPNQPDGYIWLALAKKLGLAGMRVLVETTL